MKMRSSLLIPLFHTALALSVNAAIITVTTTNNASPGAGQVSLAQAIQRAQQGDEIRFNIPGSGPHYIVTPPEGYAFITNNNVVIDGYSQPGSSANTNSILSPNNAQLRIVLDSREGGHKIMDVPRVSPNDDPGFARFEGAVLGIVGAEGVRVQGLSFLGVPQVGGENAVSLYFIALARGASGHVNGCWFGVDPDGLTVAGAADGIAGYRYRQRDNSGTVTSTVLIDHMVVGVASNATSVAQQFNVFAGMTVNPILIEGENTRISGNFIGVLPDGLHDYNVALNPELAGQFRGAVAIGRSGNNTLIGTDGDGVNDSNERNVFGGMLPSHLGGFDHLIDFYGQNPGTNIVIAGNYVGIGIDGNTRFTNGVPILGASGPEAEYRIGSNLDGVSDALEGNLIANNYPPELFPASDYQENPEALDFLSQLNSGATISLRGNSLINNFPFPVSPLRDGGFFLQNYYIKALLDPSSSFPVLDGTSTRQRLKGTVPIPDPSAYADTMIDVYIADPVGMTNGMAAEIPELPQGFVQGRTYLGSFSEGSAADLDVDPGQFEFDISALSVTAGAQLTITANFIAGTSGGGEAGDFTSIVRGDAGITLTWTSGSLQSAPAVVGPWADVDVTGNTTTVTPSDTMRFFRLQAGGSVSDGTAPPLTSPFSNAVQVQ